MTHSETIATYLRTVLDDPLRSDIIKTARVSNATGIDVSKVGSILSEMEQGAVDGVDLTRWSRGKSGGRKYQINHVADSVSGRLVVDAGTCQAIRYTLKNDPVTLKQAAERYDLSITQTRNHGAGICTHEIDEPPAQTIGKGPHKVWVDPSQ